MGCYDEVVVPCPKCGELEHFQSKGGDCIMATYSLDDAPADVMTDVNRHAPYTCLKCGTAFRVELKITVIAKSVDVNK